MMICNTRSPKRYHVAPKQGDRVGKNDILRDPFEDLCNEVICHILSFLPTIQDIGRLSILSRRWRSIWSIYPHLDFLGVNSPISLNQLPQPQRRLMLENYTERIIRSSLLRRPRCENDFSTTSKISTFYLRGYFNKDLFQQCIQKALVHKVEDLKLAVLFTGCYDLPEELFSSPAVQKLEIKSVLVPVHNDVGPGTFMFPLCYKVVGLYGFINRDLQSQLKVLTLDHVTFPSDPLASSVAMFSESYFPHLTSLTLSNCEGVYFLEVSCPNLVYLETKSTAMIKLVLKTPNLMTLLVQSCFAENEEVTSVDIWAPILGGFLWRGNAHPSWFYMQAPKHVINSEVPLEALDVEEARVESAKDLLSLFCMAKSFIVGDGLLMGLAKLDTAGFLAQQCTNLKRVKFTTSMTKKQILGMWYVLRMSPALSTLIVELHNRPYYECDSAVQDWGRNSFDKRNMSEADFWAFQSEFRWHMLQRLETVSIFIWKDAQVKDIHFASFLLQQCKRLRDFVVAVRPTVHNRAMINTIRRKISTSKAVSPNVRISVVVPFNGDMW